MLVLLLAGCGTFSIDTGHGTAVGLFIHSDTSGQDWQRTRAAGLGVLCSPDGCSIGFIRISRLVVRPTEEGTELRFDDIALATGRAAEERAAGGIDITSFGRSSFP